MATHPARLAVTTPATSVVVIGEALVDVIEIVPTPGTGVDGGERSVEHAGGSPMNIAFGLGRLGREVTLITSIGDDDRGRSISDHLASAVVSVFPGSIRSERTSTATARLSEDGSAHYEFDLRWSLPAEISLTEPPLSSAGLVHVGSIASFLEPGGAGVEEVVRALTAADPPPLVTVDPNVRPSIMPDRVRALHRFSALASCATVVKLSDEDAGWLYPGADAPQVLERVLALGPAMVALTRGGSGAVLATAGETVAIDGIPVVVADTIGAGDSFMSALVEGIAELLDEGVPRSTIRDGSALDTERLRRLGEFAVTCAALTVSRQGANPPLRAEVI